MDEKHENPVPNAHGVPLTRRQLLQAMAALAASPILAACGAPATTAPSATQSAATQPPGAVVPSATTAPAAPKSGGKVIWAMNGDPTCLGALGVLLAFGHEGKEVMYDSLAAWDRNLNVVPALAESWSTPDDKTYVFKLRQGVKFHNGQEMTADDVKYSVELQGHSGDLPKPAATIPQYPQIASVDVVDKYTVKLNMKVPDPTVLGWFAWSRWSSIIPKGFYDSGNPCTTTNGTGPFKLVEYVPNDHIAMTKNPDFWNKGLPYLDELTLKIMPEEASRVAALRAGAIDGCDLSGDTVKTLQGDPNIVVLKGLTSSPRVLQFTIKGDGKPWNDKRVRQAMSMAIDRKDLIDKVYAGQAEWTAAYPPGGNKDWTIPDADLKSNKYLKYDPDGAKALLSDAGFKNGFEIALIVTTSAEYPAIGQVVKEHLSKVGVTVNIVPQDGATFAKSYADGTFEWLLNGRGMRNDAIGYLNEFGLPNVGQANLWFAGGKGWQNDEIVKTYASVATTVDQKARIPGIIRIQQLELEEAPHVYLAQPYKFTAIRKRIQNMYVSFTDFRPGLREIWVDANA